MKAVIAGNPLRVVEIDRPTVLPGHVLVRCHASSMNPVDWKVSTSPLRWLQRLWAGAPYVPGSDFAGEVIEAGEGTEIEVGTRVVGRRSPFKGQSGSFAEFVLASPGETCRLPDEVPYDVAACLPVAGVSAWQSLFDLGGLRPEMRVLILGATGGVGHLAVQLARTHGAHVTGVCSAKNAELARELGCHEVIDYTSQDPLAAVGHYHVVLDAAGSYSVRRARAALAPRGHHIHVLPRPGVLAAHYLPGKKTHFLRADVTTQSLEPLVEETRAGRLRPLIAARYPLDQIAEAVTQSRAGRTVGKIVLEL